MVYWIKKKKNHNQVLEIHGYIRTVGFAENKYSTRTKRITSFTNCFQSRISETRLHRLNICSCHLRHKQVNCILDSIPHYSLQLDKEFDARFVPYEHWTVSDNSRNMNTIILLLTVLQIRKFNQYILYQ